MTPQRNDPTPFFSLIQASLAALERNFQALDDKVDLLSQDRVTRSDIEKLRTELLGTMVPRDAYEPRHQALIARDTQLESMIRELRNDTLAETKEIRSETSQDLQKIHERLESGKQQFEDRFEAQEKRVEDRFKDQQEAQLSVKDRAWLRFSQVIGFASIAIALIDLLLQHIAVH